MATKPMTVLGVLKKYFPDVTTREVKEMEPEARVELALAAGEELGVEVKVK